MRLKKCYFVSIFIWALHKSALCILLQNEGKVKHHLTLVAISDCSKVLQLNKAAIKAKKVAVGVQLVNKLQPLLQFFLSYSMVS